MLTGSPGGVAGKISLRRIVNFGERRGTMGTEALPASGAGRGSDPGQIIRLLHRRGRGRRRRRVVRRHGRGISRAGLGIESQTGILLADLIQLLFVEGFGLFALRARRKVLGRGLGAARNARQDCAGKNGFGYRAIAHVDVPFGIALHPVSKRFSRIAVPPAKGTFVLTREFSPEIDCP
jgi:hypothetical protein